MPQQDDRTCLQLSWQVLVGQSPAVGLRWGLVGPALGAAALVAAAVQGQQAGPAGFAALPCASAAPGGQHPQRGC